MSLLLVGAFALAIVPVVLLADVRQLEANLRALGHEPGERPFEGDRTLRARWHPPQRQREERALPDPRPHFARRSVCGGRGQRRDPHEVDDARGILRRKRPEEP